MKNNIIEKQQRHHNNNNNNNNELDNATMTDSVVLDPIPVVTIITYRTSMQKE